MLKKLAQKFISFKKKDENSALISVGLFIMVMAVFLIKMGNRHLPEDWKSEVEIWGTVSDWFIVIITLVTAVFLYKTLRSQMEVQKDQNILKDIEIKKFIKELKPNIELNLTHLYTDFDKENNKDIYGHLLDIKTTYSIKYTIDIFYDKESEVYNNKFKDNEYRTSFLGLNSHTIIMCKKVTPIGKPILLNINYEDSEGNTYLLIINIYIFFVENKYKYIISERKDTLIKTVY